MGRCCSAQFLQEMGTVAGGSIRRISVWICADSLFVYSMEVNKCPPTNVVSVWSKARFEELAWLGHCLEEDAGTLDNPFRLSTGSLRNFSVFGSHLSPHLSSDVGECDISIIRMILFNFICFLFSLRTITSIGGGTSLTLASVYSPNRRLSILIIFTFIIISFIIDVGVPQHTKFRQPPGVPPFRGKLRETGPPATRRTGFPSHRAGEERVYAVFRSVANDENENFEFRKLYLRGDNGDVSVIERGKGARGSRRESISLSPLYIY
ncbi:hypothetical protein M5K25_022577 [Dendrobium thyrsiflorum]|uniref:Uncharacterized protein n=1 Tax=Dendrobium thyrsiflorum TaxID=117978 RepID=A0ABD0UCY4_DENTH